MPVFLCIMGYFASYRPSRMVKDWLLPYVIFQTLYILYYSKVLGGEADLQYSTPYWLLWYLLAGFFCQLLIPLYDLAKGKQQFCVFGLTVGMGLLAGWDPSVSYILSMSRFLVFQPWFVLGYYMRKNGILEKLDAIALTKRIWLSAVAFLGVLGSVLYIYICKPSEFVLYGSAPYKTFGSCWDRLAIMGLAFAWIAFLLIAMRPILSRKIPFIGRIGQNSLPVYLLHGFVTQWLKYKKYAILQKAWTPFLLALGLLLLLGHPCLTKLLRGKLFKKKSA